MMSTASSVKAKVSVILPIHNAASFIKQSLGSVIRQTLKDIEIICLDDCSSDNSWELLQQIGLQDDRVILIRNSHNLGVARTRNIGLQIAEGEYICFLDADDWISAECLATAYVVAHSNKADVCFYGMVNYSASTGVEKPYFNLPYAFKERMKSVFDAKSLHGYLYSSGTPCDKISRRDFLLENNLQFQNIRNENDSFFNALLFAIAPRMVRIPNVFYHRRLDYSTGITASREQEPLCFVSAERKLQHYLKLYGRWELVRRFYHGHVVNSMMYTLSVVSPAVQRQIVEFMRKQGMSELGMENLGREDFLDNYSFWVYSLLQSCRTIEEYLENRQDTRQYAYIEDMRNLAREMSHRDLNIAVWGYGKLGTQMVHVFKECGCNLRAVYDKSLDKHGFKDDVRISGYRAEAIQVDLIVISNSRYCEEILEDIKSAGGSERLFDFDSYRLGMLPFDDCIIYI